MNPRLKQALLVALFIAITLGLGFLIYFVFFRKAAPTVTPTIPQAGVPGALPSAGTGAPGIVTPTVPPGGLPVAGGIPSILIPGAAAPSRTTVLSENVAASISMSPQGGIRSWNAADGKFYRIADDGTAVPMSNQQFFNVDQVVWGNRTDQAVISYPDGSKILYNFSTDKQVTLPNHWEDFDFSPGDDQVVAKSVGDNESNRFLVVANPDGTSAKLVEDLGDNQDKVFASWSPNNQTVAYSFTGDPLGFDRQAVVLVGQNHENFKNLVVEGRGFVPNWSPTGNNLLYSVYNSSDGYRPSLWVSGASGDSINADRRELQLNTWADKCAWQNESSLICAVPQSLPEGAGLQRDAFGNIPDIIYRIDLTTGQKINLGQPDGAPTVSQMTLSPDGKTMYFTDKNTGKLLKFDL